MPYKRSYSGKRKRSYRKRRRYIPRTKRIRRVWRKKFKRLQKKDTRYINGARGNILGDKLFAKLIYFNSKYSNQGAGPIAGLVQYSGSGAECPDITVRPSTTDSPKGWDQLCSNLLYRRYMVHAAKITTRVRILSNNAGDVGKMVNLFLIPTNPNTTVATTDDNKTLGEYPKAIVKHAIIQAVTSGENGTFQPTKFSQFIGSKKMFGVNELVESDYAALYNATPTNEWTWNIMFRTLDGIAAAGTIIMELQTKIKYYVQFYEASFKTTS